MIPGASIRGSKQGGNSDSESLIISDIESDEDRLDLDDLLDPDVDMNLDYNMNQPETLDPDANKTKLTLASPDTSWRKQKAADLTATNAHNAYSPHGAGQTKRPYLPGHSRGDETSTDPFESLASAPTSTKDGVTHHRGGAAGSEAYKTNYNESDSVFDQHNHDTRSPLKGDYGQRQGNKVEAIDSEAKLQSTKDEW